MTPAQRKAHDRLSSSLPSKVILKGMGNWDQMGRPLSQEEEAYLWKIEPDLELEAKNDDPLGT
jgi:hypothetical protein